MIETEISSVLVPAFFFLNLGLTFSANLFACCSKASGFVWKLLRKWQILKLINWMYYIVVVVVGELQCLANV